MFGNVLFAPEHTPDEVIRVDSSAIHWQVGLIVFLIVVSVILFFYVRNTFSGYFMAVLWGGLGCYIYHQAIEAVVDILRGLALSAFVTSGEGETLSMHPVAPFISILFVFLEALILVAWLFAFYKFFILLKAKPTMGSTVNVSFGYLLIEYFIYFINFLLSILTANSINSKANFAELTSKMNEDGIKELDRYLDGVSAYNATYSVGLIIEFIALIFFSFAVFIFLHCYMTRKEAKPCFSTAVMFVGSYLLWDHTLFANNLGILTPILKLIIAVIGLIFALKFLKEHCPEHHALFVSKFKKGPVYLLFHKTPTDKPGVKNSSNSKIASKAAKNARVGNFKDLHKLDKSDKTKDNK
ncbi:MAG: hypothetical protein J6T47_07270 [Lachnospiraceae bacterium]|nr:hypothetical protein [Lachnospiraceae bacterium]